MTLKKTIYNFKEFQLDFSVLNLFNSVCKDWSTSLRQFSLLEGAQRMFFGPFSQESFFRNAVHSVQSSDLVVEMSYPVPITKKLSFPDNNFEIESVLQNCIQTVHMLVLETICNHFL